MNTLSILYSANQLIQVIALTTLRNVSQLTDQFGEETQQTPTDFAHYGLLVVGLTCAIALLFSSLLLVLRHQPAKPVQPTLRVAHRLPADQYPTRPVVRASRNEGWLVSVRLRAEQFSN